MIPPKEVLGNTDAFVCYWNEKFMVGLIRTRTD